MLESTDEGTAETSRSYIYAYFAAHLAGPAIRNWSEYVVPVAAPIEVTAQMGCYFFLASVELGIASVDVGTAESPHSRICV